MSESNDKIEKLGATIRLIRFMMGYSVDELAAYAKIDRKYLSDIEHGYKNAGILTYEKICEGLDIKLSELIASVE